MGQLNLALIGRMDEAGIVPHCEITKVQTYRDAVRMCWLYRRSQRMTQNTVAEYVEGMYPQHLSDYLADSAMDKHGRARRELPAHLIRGFQAVCGNKFITQWLAHQEGLTLMESVLAERKYA